MPIEPLTRSPVGPSWPSCSSWWGQGTPRLGPPDWETEAALAERNHSVSLAGDTGFFRIADAAQHQGIPFTLHMTGDAERPNPVTTGASGSGLMRLDGNTLTFNVRYQGLSGLATAAHIHGPAPAAEAAGVRNSWG